VEDDPMDFSLYRGTERPGIIPDSINTYIDLGVYRLAGFREVKGDDIGIVVMMKILFVYTQQVIIRAEDILELCQLLFFLSKKRRKKTF
jgi:hypothetical protein